MNRHSVQHRPLAHLVAPGMRRSALQVILLASLLLPAVGGGAAWAQELNWQSNYNAARREAQEKGRPMILDFVTSNCSWCTKLDMTTFRDPPVVGLMNEHFVLLKIYAPDNPTLVDALKIESFPTLVLAGSDGKILEMLKGYQEPIRFHAILQRTLGVTIEPEWMVRDYQEATKAITGADYPRALALLKGILEDGKERSVQLKARQLLQDLEQQAATILVRARQAEDRGQTTEALDVLQQLLRTFAGTQAANDGGQLLTHLTAKPEIRNEQRTRRARELLAQAREDYRTQQYLCCMDRCEVLAGSYADLPEGMEAHQLASEIKNNPEWMREACENLSERLGLLYLALAETWLKKGQPQEAVLCLERVIQAFPGTRQADAAMMRLAQVQGRPMQHAEYKRPELPR